MEVSAGIPGLKVNKYYKYILTVVGIILILSLFVDVSGSDISNATLRHHAFWVILAGLLVWVVDDIVDSIRSYLAYLYDSNKLYQYEHEQLEMLLAIVFWMFQGTVWLFVFLMLT